MKYNLICWEITKKSMQFIQAWPGYVYTNFTDWARFVTLKKKTFFIEEKWAFIWRRAFYWEEKMLFCALIKLYFFMSTLSNTIGLMTHPFCSFVVPHTCHYIIFWVYVNDIPINEMIL